MGKFNPDKQVIYKTRLELLKTGYVDIKMQLHAEILSVGIQSGIPVMWYKCDPKEKMVNRKLFIAWTGEEMDKFPFKHPYIGTIQEYAAGLVWHVFDAVMQNELPEVKP